MKIIGWIVRLLVFVALLLLALQNQHTVNINGLFGTQASWPLAWVLALTLSLGALLGVLAMLPRLLRRKAAAASSTSPATISTQHPEDHGLGI